MCLLIIMKPKDRQRICKIFKRSQVSATLETGKHKMAMLSVLQTATKQKTEYLGNPREHPEFRMTTESTGSFKLIRFSFSLTSRGIVTINSESSVY